MLQFCKLSSLQSAHRQTSLSYSNCFSPGQVWRLIPVRIICQTICNLKGRHNIIFKTLPFVQKLSLPFAVFRSPKYQNFIFSSVKSCLVLIFLINLIVLFFSLRYSQYRIRPSNVSHCSEGNERKFQTSIRLAFNNLSYTADRDRKSVRLRWKCCLLVEHLRPRLKNLIVNQLQQKIYYSQEHRLKNVCV